jgi:hypothetical protein
MKWLFVPLFLFTFSVGCGGTGTGNPTGTGATNGSASGTAAEAVLSASCGKLASCFNGLTISDCSAGIKVQTNLSAALGLAANFGTYQAIIDAEKAGTIHANGTAKAACVSDIGALACSNGAVQSSYSASAPGDFSQVFQLIPSSTSSCKGLY